MDKGSQGHTPALFVISEYTQVTEENRHVLLMCNKLMHCTNARCLPGIGYLGVVGKGHYPEGGPY
eukprot:16447575-Heterocapsa_arctica.AAC.1